MEERECNFFKYQRLIQKQAHKYADRFKLEYEELESMGYLIYVECVEKFDVTKKAQFSTYLYIELKKLGDVIKKEYRTMISLDDDFNSKYYCEEPVGSEGHNLSYSLFDYIDGNPCKDVSLSDLLADSKEHLSEFGYRCFSFLVNREWEDLSNKFQKLPTINIIAKQFNLTRRSAEKVWGELKDYWNSTGYFLYA